MSATSQGTSRFFRNWVGNQSCTPRDIRSPADEAEVQEIVRDEAARGGQVRVVATGHSFTPVHLTSGTLIGLDRLHGVLGVDAERRRVTALPGTAIGAFGEPLWEHGLALKNQGDIDTQGITGAMGTATHGSGLGYQHLGAALRRCRVVAGDGEVVEIGEDDPDLLHAAQVSVGMLGVITEVELEVKEAYALREEVAQWSIEEIRERFVPESEARRHCSMFWCPTDESAALYGLEMEPGRPIRDSAFIRIYDEAPADTPADPTHRRRVDRSYRVFPMVYDPNFHELEYFVRWDRAMEAFEALRELMLASQPAAVFPMEVRSVGRDAAMLSPQHEQDTIVLSVSGRPGTDYWDYLRSVDALLGGQFDARVHWGKLHFLSREQLLERYPRAQDFIDVRRRLDPEGLFLNDHLRPLFA